MKAGMEGAATERFHLLSAGLLNHRGTRGAAALISAFFGFDTVIIATTRKLLCIRHVLEEQRAARLQGPGSIQG